MFSYGTVPQTTLPSLDRKYTDTLGQQKKNSKAKWGKTNQGQIIQNKYFKNA